MAPGPKGSRAKPRVGTRINPIKAIQDQEWRRQQLAAASRSSTPSAASTPPPTIPKDKFKPQCPNKNCKNPNVVDGTCRSCGRVADDSNIVAEIQFGETAQGAAVVQGSYIGPDQGVARMSGTQGGRRIAGTNTSLEAREKALREARNHIAGFAHQLNLPERTINGAFQLYKLASNGGFTQGRPSHLVAAMCLYAACRKDENMCKIMLIDLADLVKHDVFHLGRMYKMFTKSVGVGLYQPVFAEDLIFRFAARLEFGELTNKVAETAIRLVQRMDRDWIVMGRRPSGICGACLIMAARMHNFRRMPRELAFIAKVTMHTLQQRLDEFAVLPSAKLSVEDFLVKDFLYDQMDPPAFYKKSEEYQNLLKQKRANAKRKRDQDDDGGEERRVDADGFAIPQVPASRATATATSTATAMSSGVSVPVDAEGNFSELGSDDQHLDELALAFGDGAVPGIGSSNPFKKRKKYPQGSSCRKQPKIEKPVLNEEWIEDQELLEAEITENMMNPSTTEGALRIANAQELASLKLLHFGIDNTNISPLDNPTVAADEFEDDDEVHNCLLSPEEAEIKMQLWVNQNKDWLLKQQEKEFKRRMAEANPRASKGRGGGGRGKRARQARIGEGQTSPADSATQSTVDMCERRQFSKRIDYSAINTLFSIGGLGSEGGSLATSRQTSVAPTESQLGSDGEDDEDDGDMPQQQQSSSRTGASTTAAPKAVAVAANRAHDVEMDDDDDDDEDDYEEALDYDDDAEPEIDPFAND